MDAETYNSFCIKGCKATGKMKVRREFLINLPGKIGLGCSFNILISFR